LIGKVGPNVGVVAAVVVLLRAAMEAQLRAGLLLDRRETVVCCFSW